MRCLARVGLALCGLALTTPASVWAQAPAAPNGVEYNTGLTELPKTSQPKPRKKMKSRPKVAKAPQHRHEKDWLGREIICPECQYNAMRAQGINVPPPPRTGAMASAPASAPGQPGTTVVAGPGQMTPELEAFLNQIPKEPGQIIILNSKDVPGYAVVGDAPATGTTVASGAPGTAVVGGAPGEGPSPVGVATPRRGNFFAKRSAQPTAPTDHSVMPSSVTASDPIDPGPSGNPRVLGHLFGISALRRDFRDGMDARNQKKRDAHAAISYDTAPGKVTDLPASMVYGR